jgi:Dimerisation domain
MELRDEAISVDAKLANQFQSLMSSSWKSQALYVAAELGIADLLASAPRHSAEMAKALGADQQCLQRLLWALSALGICAEREDGNFELTDLGALLQDSSPYSLRARASPWDKGIPAPPERSVRGRHLLSDDNRVDADHGASHREHIRFLRSKTDCRYRRRSRRSCRPGPDEVPRSSRRAFRPADRSRKRLARIRPPKSCTRRALLVCCG